MRDIPIHTLFSLLGPSRCHCSMWSQAVTLSYPIWDAAKDSLVNIMPGLTDTVVALTSDPDSLSPHGDLPE